MNIDYTADQALTQLRAFLLWALPEWQVLQGQQNNATMPLGEFVIMTPLHMSALETTRRTYDRPNGKALNAQGKELRVQLDCYGESAMDAASALAALFRSPASTEWMERYALDGGFPLRLQVLYASDARNVTFINEASNYEGRWTLDVHLQINQTVTTPQEFAEQLNVDTAEADTSLARQP